MADQNQGQNQGGGQDGQNQGNRKNRGGGNQPPKPRCPKCGADNQAGNNCTACGKPMRVKCPGENCGAVVPNTTFCSACGHQLNPATTAQPAKAGEGLWAIRILAPTQPCHAATLGFQITHKGEGKAGQVRVTIDGRTLTLVANDKGLAELPVVIDHREVHVTVNIVGCNNPEAQDSMTLYGKPPRAQGSFLDKLRARRDFYKPQQ